MILRNKKESSTPLTEPFTQSSFFQTDFLEQMLQSSFKENAKDEIGIVHSTHLVIKRAFTYKCHQLLHAPSEWPYK